MKRFTAIELVMLIFTISVSATILLGIVGMAVMGKTTVENAPIRLALTDLLKSIVGALFVSVGVMINNKKQQE